jgi:hypothetical protein
MARALIVGIEKYDNVPHLTGCVNDARAMLGVLESNEDGSPNFDCRILISPGRQRVTRKLLLKELSKLFEHYDEDVLFYFSGHGHPTELGGYIVTQDAEPGDPGINMNDLLTLANKSTARSVLLILDCCFAGGLGDPTALQGSERLETKALLREGLTILAASRPMQTAGEADGYGVFTSLVVDALRGGAADVRGYVSAAAIYAYVEQALGSWEQRPVYKSHAHKLEPIRRCQPAVPDSLLRKLPEIFKNPEGGFRLTPAYEYTHPSAKREQVELFNHFKALRNARLITTQDNKDLFFIALKSKKVYLTPLGRYYWQLARSRRIR